MVVGGISGFVAKAQRWSVGPEFEQLDTSLSHLIL